MSMNSFLSLGRVPIVDMKASRVLPSLAWKLELLKLVFLVVSLAEDMTACCGWGPWSSVGVIHASSCSLRLACYLMVYKPRRKGLLMMLGRSSTLGADGFVSC